MTWTSAHGFCGCGDAHGFQEEGIEVLGGWDEDPLACEDFETFTGVRPHCGDVLDLTPRMVRNDVCQGRRPDIFILSPPCKGNSLLLPEAAAKSEHYQKLNSLSQFGVWLILEAWPDSPPPLILLENVENITSRSRPWLDQTIELLHHYGYAVTESKHDCGELGGLAQRRRRYLLVARHMEQCPALLFEPPKMRVKGIGEVIGDLPVPIAGKEGGGPMHHLPRLSPMNWLRLASIPAGGDYRDLPERVRLANGELVDPGVNKDYWATTYGVADWQEAARCVVANACHDNGEWTVADPRTKPNGELLCYRQGKSLGVKSWGEPSTTITANGTIHNHPQSVTDPRRVVPTHALLSDDGEFTLVGPELDLDALRYYGPVPYILAPDGCWHRPLTTLELAALQGFPTKINGEWIKFAGNSHADWRERIGNAIPPPTAQAIARSCIRTLEASRNAGFMLSSDAIWVDQEERGAA